MEIKSIFGRMILDSRGNPTVEAEVTLSSGGIGRAAVPSGASAGSHEAIELRDGGEAYRGLGVTKAVGNINGEIAAALIGHDSSDQAALDQALIALDGTANKARLGANAILAVSLAAAHAAAKHMRIPLFRHIANLAGNDTLTLPRPMMNILNGGAHAKGSTDIQEMMIVPIGAKSFSRSLEMGADVFHALGKLLAKHNYATTVGDEGGYAPALAGNHREALDLIIQSITDAGYEPGKDVALAIDMASSELFKNDVYHIDGTDYSSDTLIDWYAKLATDYPIVSLEDGLAEDDWSGWTAQTEALGDRLQLVGDDLLVTNTERLKRAIDEQACNAILIKPNQIGTLTETIAAVQMAEKAGMNTIISHRSGETEDVTIAHLAVALNAGQIKTGSLSRSERIAKYNELLRVEETGIELATVNYRAA